MCAKKNHELVCTGFLFIFSVASTITNLQCMECVVSGKKRTGWLAIIRHAEKMRSRIRSIREFRIFRERRKELSYKRTCKAGCTTCAGNNFSVVNIDEKSCAC